MIEKIRKMYVFSLNMYNKFDIKELVDKLYLNLLYVYTTCIIWQTEKPNDFDHISCDYTAKFTFSSEFSIFLNKLNHYGRV